MAELRRLSKSDTISVERIVACTSVTQKQCKMSHKVKPEADNEIELDIYPDKEKKNIARINGGYRGFRCILEEDELSGLPLKLNGAGGGLTDRMKFHLKGQKDKQGNFEIFLVGVATTMVQFKLWGEMFPEVDNPAGDKISPEIFRDEIFRKLGRLRNSSVPGLSEWVSGMLSFWEKWQGIFQLDLQNDIIERLNEFREVVFQRLEYQDKVLAKLNYRLEQLELTLIKLEKAK